MEIVIPNVVSVYKQVKALVGSTTTLGRVRISMTNTDMKLVCENECDVATIKNVLAESGVLSKNEPKHIEPVKQKQHIYKPEPKVSKRKIR